MVVNVYKYTDYRMALHDWFWTSKKDNLKLSFRYVSMHLGLKAPNHFHLVITRKRNLSLPVFEKMLRLMKLDPMDRQYFKLLFRENTAKSAAIKKELSAQIELFRNAPLSKSPQDERLQIVGHSLAWYIKMGAVVFEGKTREALVKLVRESSTFPSAGDNIDDDINKAIDVLLSAKQLKFVGGLSQFEGGDIRTSWDFDSLDIKNHHQSNLTLAAESISWPLNKRFLSSVTVPCNDELYESVISEVRALCLSILERSGSQIVGQCDASKVVTLQMALFPYFQFQP
jgi:uncharacterized protein (TIGR02147 family)